MAQEERAAGEETAATAAQGPQGQPGPGGPQGQPGPGGPQGVPGLQGIPGLSSGVDALTDVVDALRVEVAEQNELAKSAKRLADTNRGWIKFLLVSLLIGVLAFGGAFYAIAQNNRKFCDVVAVSTDPSPPPTSDRGRAGLEKAQKLSRDLGCG